MKNMVVKKGIQYYHDDQYSDGRVKILLFPLDGMFGDFRIFNKLPIELVDEFLGRFKEIMVDIVLARMDYENYWETHPNRDEEC